MKFSSAIVLGAASLASAQSIGSLVSQIPTCADACLLKYIPMVCSGGVTDYACSCMPANKAKITMESTTCVVDACQVEKALMVQSLTGEICSVFSKNGSGSSASATMSSSASSSASASSSMASATSSTAESSSSSSSSSAAMSTPAASSSSASSAVMSASSSVAAVSNGASKPMVTAAPALAAAAAAMLML